MEDYIKFFNTNNKSGVRTREKYVKRNNIELYNQIINYSIKHDLDLEFKQLIYHFLYQIEKVPKCLECSKKSVFNNIKIGYKEFCSNRCLKSSNIPKKKVERIYE